MNKIYKRQSAGRISEGIEPTETVISQKEGLAEINEAMMNGHRTVLRMSSISRTDYHIVYRTGEVVVLTLVDEPQPETAAPVDEQPEATWSTASLAHLLLHRFTGEDDPKDRRALCNKRFRATRYANGYNFETRTERDASEYGDLYTYCTRCEGK